MIYHILNSVCVFLSFLRHRLVSPGLSLSLSLVVSRSLSDDVWEHHLESARERSRDGRSSFQQNFTTEFRRNFTSEFQYGISLQNFTTEFQYGIETKFHFGMSVRNSNVARLRARQPRSTLEGLVSTETLRLRRAREPDRARVGVRSRTSTLQFGTFRYWRGAFWLSRGARSVEDVDEVLRSDLEGECFFFSFSFFFPVLCSSFFLFLFSFSFFSSFFSFNLLSPDPLSSESPKVSRRVSTVSPMIFGIFVKGRRLKSRDRVSGERDRLRSSTRVQI